MSYQKSLVLKVKKDPKSPLSLYTEEDSQDNILKKSKQIIRPQSAKPKKPKSLVKPGKRPLSAKKQPPKSKTPVKSFNEPEMALLNKLKPRNIPMDKERLYEENMALKLQLNISNEEITKFKTKISQLEKQAEKNEVYMEDAKNVDKYTPSNLKHIHLVTNLRNNVKELRKEIQKKDNEILALRKSLKQTKTGEYEIEMQAYIDECTRLRHHLEEVIRERDTGNSEDQSYMVTNLKQENQDLNQLMVKIKSEALQWKERAEKLGKQKRKVSKEDQESSSSEMHNLRLQLETANQKLAKKDQDHKIMTENHHKETNEIKIKLQKAEKQIKEQMTLIQQIQKSPLPVIPHNVLDNPNELLLQLHKIVMSNKVDISDVLSQLDKNKKGLVEIEEIVKGCKLFGANIESKYVKEAIYEFTGKPQLFISVKDLKSNYDRFVFNDQLSEGVDEAKITPRNSPIKQVLHGSPVKNKPEPSPTKTTEKKPTENQIATIKLTQVSNTMTHISFRMQLHRLDKLQLYTTLFSEKNNSDKPISHQELSLLLNKPPFNITDKNEVINLSKFLIEPENTELIPESQYKLLKAGPKQIIKKLEKYIED